ncbi:STAS domain-containing protein [Propionivibrio sp.]|uniref:STAS domain-containing protein n=1 Tax=Propionivibrio sp. TaxID=2212460 RepID=UPI003BF0EB28
MAIEFIDIDEGLRRIFISGRLDIMGTDEIATKFASFSSSAERRVVVDLTAVSFLASIGIRAIITNAKALKQRGGRMVLFVGDNATVAKTLETTGVDALIPMYLEYDAAEKGVLA